MVYLTRYLGENLIFLCLLLVATDTHRFQCGLSCIQELAWAFFSYFECGCKHSSVFTYLHHLLSEAQHDMLPQFVLSVSYLIFNHISTLFFTGRAC